MVVHFTLDVHEDEASRETYPDDYELRPEGPLQISQLDLLHGTFYEHVERPDDAGDGDNMKRHGADDFSALHFRHLQFLPLAERLDRGRHPELQLAEFARLRVGTLYPLLKAVLVDIFEGARARTGGYERVLRIGLAMADATDVGGRRSQRSKGSCLI